MILSAKMADLSEENDNRFDDIDVESILARVERRGPLTFSRKRCLYQAPEFVKRLSGEETVDEGTTVRFECKVIGFPKPTISWLKDEESIDGSNKVKVEDGEAGSGCYAISITDVEKTDEGTYRVRASNGEGSCSSTVFLSVKVKCQSPKKKKKKHHVSFPPDFPPIAEKVVEEEKAAVEQSKQPKSPLTHLYDTICIRQPLTYPEFLGEWAFVSGLAQREEEDMDIGCEDVFENETDVYDTGQTTLHEQNSSSPASTQPTLTFVSSSYAQLADDSFRKKETEKNLKNMQHAQKPVDKKCGQATVELKKQAHAQRPLQLNLSIGHQIFGPNESNSSQTGNDSNKTICKQHGLSPDTLNNNKTNVTTQQNGNLTVCLKENTPSRIHTSDRIQSYTQVMVNGDSNHEDSEKLLVKKETEVEIVTTYVKEIHACKDVSELQNKNNETLLTKMKKGRDSASKSSFLPGTTFSISDDLLGIFLLISCSTFIALYCDMPPGTFVFDVFLAFIMKVLLEFVFKEN